jgi:DNA (cytosine-5)-methyltransferase 1
MKRNKTIYAADLFCGGGGTSEGLRQACEMLGYKLWLLGINHWDVAIATHSRNHTYAKHICENLDNVNPRKVIPWGWLNLLVASPECTHHSNARGGKPCSDQSRASAWHILRWAEALRIDNILIENVKEFQTWGPLGSNGRPLKSRKGETFQAFINALRSLGYKVDFRVLNAAYYGDPTTRERLFIVARRGRRPIVWPAPTHSPDGGDTIFGKTKRWRTAREIIDWDIPGQSIFSRKKPLSKNTINRYSRACGNSPDRA